MDEIIIEYKKLIAQMLTSISEHIDTITKIENYKKVYIMAKRDISNLNDQLKKVLISLMYKIFQVDYLYTTAIDLSKYSNIKMPNIKESISKAKIYGINKTTLHGKILLEEHETNEYLNLQLDGVNEILNNQSKDIDSVMEMKKEELDYIEKIYVTKKVIELKIFLYELNNNYGESTPDQR